MRLDESRDPCAFGFGFWSSDLPQPLPLPFPVYQAYSRRQYAGRQHHGLPSPGNLQQIRYDNDTSSAVSNALVL